MSIRNRLTVVTLVTIAISLVTIVGGLFAFDYVDFQDRIKTSVSNYSEILAKSSSAAIVFADTAAAERSLAALQSDDRLVYAAILTADGQQLASVGDPPASLLEDSSAYSTPTRLDEGHVVSTHPVFLESDEEVIGFAKVVLDNSEWNRRVEHMSVVVPGLALLSLVLVVFIVKKWQRRISDPLVSLTKEDNALGSDKSFDRQITIEADGEVQHLIEGVNSMLGTIQEGKSELEEANRLLDNRVRERTAELEAEVKERSKAEAEVRRNQTIVDDFLDNAPLGIAWVSEQGRIKRSNEVLRETLECNEERIKESEIASYFVDTELARDFLQRLNRGETIPLLLAQVRSSQDSIRWVQISANVFWHNGRFGFARVFMLDVTEIRAANEANEARSKLEHANRAKNDFLSRMSHELRTPMNAILGFAQLMLLDKEKLSEKHQEFINHILAAGKHLLSLITEVLNIAKIESGHMSLSLESIDLCQVVREVTGLLNPQARDKQVTVSVMIEPDQRVLVSGDRQRIVQVLVNVVGNAIKYNVDGGSVDVWLEEAGPERTKLYVRDTGLGLRSDKLDRLFIPFERLDAESTGIEGTGLGLALSKSLMQAMGGDIELVSSTPGEGSVFCVELQSRSVDGHELNDHSLVQSPEAESCLKNEAKLLYIEDNEMNVELMKQFVSRLGGWSLTVATKGQEGLELFEHEEFDVVLLDLHLPDTKGSDILKRIRMTSKGQHAHVIIVSADVREPTVRQLSALGASAFCGKPLDFEELESTLVRLFESNTLDQAG